MKRARELLSPYLRRCANGHSGPAFEFPNSGRYLCRRCLVVAEEGQRQAAAREKARLDDRRRLCREKRERKRKEYQDQRFELHDIDDKGADDGRFVYAHVHHSDLIHTVRVNAARCVDVEGAVSFETIGPGLTARNTNLKEQVLSPGTLFIPDFCIWPYHQNIGIGSAIMDIFFKYVDRFKVNAVYGHLSTADLNAEGGQSGIDEGRRERLIHFYTKFGFDVTWFETVHEEGLGRIDWRRDNPRTLPDDTLAAR